MAVKRGPALKGATRLRDGGAGEPGLKRVVCPVWTTFHRAGRKHTRHQTIKRVISR